MGLANFPVSSRITWISANQTADLDGRVTLGCTAIGRPTPRVMWKKDGRILLENQATANITLNIAKEHHGIFECSAVNIVGNDTKTTAVDVQGWDNKQFVSLYHSFFLQRMPLIKSKIQSTRSQLFLL